MPVAATRLDERMRHGIRRYAICSDEFLTCTLVYGGDGTWLVEKTGATGERVSLSLYEFETSNTGQRLAVNFAAALAVAAADL
jgi:hypothetical protein